MSYKQLKKFIKEQAIRGENPAAIRDGLIMNGWDAQDVDRAISDVYGKKKKILGAGLFFVLILIIVSSISLLFIYSELTDEKIPTDDDTTTRPSLEEHDSCKTIDDAYERELCYIEEIEDGYECEDLTGEDAIDCSRALEVHIRATQDA